MSIVWSARAASDLDDIETWIAERNVRAAIDTIDAIIRSAVRLTDHPLLGRPGRVEGARELPVTGTPYLIVYVVRPDDVAIVRVLHGAHRWPRLPSSD